MAISSAGATWSVARSCAAGRLAACSCNIHQHTSQQSWEWGGCSYSVKFGLITSRRLLTRNGHRRRRGLLRKIYRHNLKAGRLVSGNRRLFQLKPLSSRSVSCSVLLQAVKKTLAKACKCHGVSGSCQLKTCWKATADLRRIGDHLKEKYREAKLLLKTSSPNASRQLFVSAAAKSAELVFFEKSPGFCRPLSHLRTAGTKGRVCNVRNKTQSAGDCQWLCCARGHHQIRQDYTENCNCKFEWCCRVICEKCTRSSWISMCF